MSTASTPRISALEVCPPDILRCVTALLPGADVMALFLCGAPRLSARLFNEGVSSLQFDWTSRRYRIWYPFVMKFRRLERLALAASYERFFRRFEWSPNFSTLLELEFTMTSKTTNAALWLDSVDPLVPGTPLNLRLAAPNLNTLKIRQCSVSHAFLSLLPESLRTLQVLIKPTIGPDGREPLATVIAVLPRDLEHLWVKPLLGTDSATIAALPPKLKTLHSVGEFEVRTLDEWPKSLQLLEGDTTMLPIESLEQLPSFIQDVRTPHTGNRLHIPDHVTSLTLTTRTDAMSLPSGLTSLKLHDAHNWGLNDFKSLPKTLTSLETRHMGPTVTAEVLPFLPKLKSLTLQRIESFGDEWLLLGLPDTLTELELLPCFSWTDEAIAHLPVGLRNVNLTRLKKITDIGIRHLPYTLTSIKLMSTMHVTGNCFRDLPGGLLTFALEYAQNVEDYHLSHLPRLLTYLRLGYAEKLTDDGFKLLPRRLMTLSLDEKGPSHSVDRVADLPHSLTQINSTAKNYNEFVAAYFKVQPLMLDTDEREEPETPIIVPKQPKAIATDSSGSIFSTSFWKGVFSSKKT